MNQFFDDEDDGKDFETETKPGSVQNTDSNSLPSSGEGAEVDEYEPTGYIPTGEEVLQLMKYWHTRVLNNDWLYFFTGSTGGYRHRELMYAYSRFELAEAAIGKEAVRAAIDEARKEFKTVIDRKRFWKNFGSSTREQWEEVSKETWRKCDTAADFRLRLKELEAAYPEDMVALVLRDLPEGKRKPVLVSATFNSKLSAALQASGEFAVETDTDMTSSLVVGQRFTKISLLRIRRKNGEWRFSGPGTKKGTTEWEYLRWLVGRINPMLKACMGGRQEHTWRATPEAAQGKARKETMNRNFEAAEANDKKEESTTEAKPGSVQNTESNSLPSTGAGVEFDEDAPTTYVPSRLEVLELVKDWYTRELDYDFDCFISGCFGGDMGRTKWYVSNRFKLAEEAVGEEAVLAAIKEAHEEFGTEVDGWRWAIFRHGSDKQWTEVSEDSWRYAERHQPGVFLEIMEELETKHPKDLIGFVLRDGPADKCKPVLFFSTPDLELAPLLKASPEFEVLTDKSRLWIAMLNRDLRYNGFIRARRQGKDWLFDFPRSERGTGEWCFLESVRYQIKKLLGDTTGREFKEPWNKFWEENLWKFTQDRPVDVVGFLELQEKDNPDNTVMLVLRGPLADQDRAVLFTSAKDPELLALLQKGGRLEIETDGAKIRTLIGDQGFRFVGDLEINRGERSLVTGWMTQSIDDWNFLMNVRDQVWELIRGRIAKNSRNQ